MRNIMQEIIVTGIPVLLRFFFLVFIFPVSTVLAQDFTISRFHSDILINDDSSFTVKETISVVFHRPKHGIYREIPFRYTDDLGNSFTTPIEVMSVTDASGEKWKTKISNQNNVVHIRIGDAAKYVDGSRTFVIFYRVLENALLFFDDHDELYWNVTGNYWKAPIREASANVMLVTENKGVNLWASCYTGIHGSRQSDCRFDTHPGSAQFFTKRGLNAGEGLTVAFGWDKGLVHPPPAVQIIFRRVKENWFFVLPFLSLAFMTKLWRTRGRDPSVRESVTVMYQPPLCDGKTLSPAEVGAIVDEKVDPRDITSTIVGLAVKGFIRIEETRKDGLIFDSTDYYLARVKNPDSNLGLFETELMKNIFSGAVSGILISELKNRFYVHLQPLKKTLYSEIVGKKYFLRSPEQVRAFYIGMAVVTALATVSLSALIAYWLLPSASFTPPALFKSVIAGLITGLPVAAFALVMPAKTKTGASVYMDILGFQEFLNRAEKDHLARMGDKDLFSKFLPYAIALDVADNWSRAFEGIYQDPPQWYVSEGGFRTFSSRSFSHSIDSMSSSLSSAMFSTPRGSCISSGGSGGGGSSGGGFGGGGGGSW
ncbi:MAG TPA: DUF2207 domain-containing protein [Thermodesulfovibrionales bacterium]|nr:DUF2207 domain-containing protein [Thermodesulfovibrionales bacterium]